MQDGLTARARVETPNGTKYAEQLCKHFAHKVDARFADGVGECRFSCGEARLSPDGAGLAITVKAPDAGGLSETKDVIERHLLRFAFREELQPIVWGDAASLDAEAPAAR